MAALSYLDVLRAGNDVFLGGLMTVNELGLPTEFLHSDPIKPSQLQVSLYGTTLGRYITLDLIGKGLVEASQARGVPVIVSHSDMLALATQTKRPLCQLTPTNQRPLDDVGQLRESSSEEFVAQLSEVSSPYHFRIFDRVNFPIEKHISAFIECASRFDLLEPLGRVKRTLELLRDKDE